MRIKHSIGGTIMEASQSKSTYLANGSIANDQNFKKVIVGECLRRWGGHDGDLLLYVVGLERNEIIEPSSRMIVVATEHTTAKTVPRRDRDSNYLIYL
jgi:hypothetical protein